MFFKLLTIVISLIGFAVSLFSPASAWIILSVPAALLLVILFFAMRTRMTFEPQLSLAANGLRRRFAHYYTWPFASRDFSHCASVLDIAGIVVAVIGLFHAFWWGIALGLVAVTLMTNVAMRFDPTFGGDDERMRVHEEIVSFIERDN